MKVVDDQMEQAATELRKAVKAVRVPAAPTQRMSSSRMAAGGMSLIAAAFAVVLIIGIPALLLGPIYETSQLAGSPTEGTGGPGSSEPVEQPNSDLPTLLDGHVQTLPGFPSDATASQLMDAGESREPMLIVSYTTDDGSLIDVVVQRLAAPMPIEMIDPSGTARTSTGPDGESITFVDKNGHTIQLIAVDHGGLTVNLIIERINRIRPDQPSSLMQIAEDTLTQWALTLLDAMKQLL